MENVSVTTIRLERKVLKSIDDFASSEHSDRTTIMRKALEKGLVDLRLQRAFHQYSTGKASAWKAASLAGVSLWDFLEALQNSGFSFKADEKETLRQLGELDEGSN